MAARAADWSSLPAGVVRYILGQASTCQAPGSCLGAPVCRQWRSAAAAAAASAAAGGGKGIRLLYQAGHDPSDQSFAAWLAVNSRQLGSLTLTTSTSDLNSMGMWDNAGNSSANGVLGALAKAATAAAAAGSPLPLHTLRVLGEGPDLDITGHLLAGLPHLHTLQLNVWGGGYPGKEAYERAMQEHLAPLKAATQLENLYFPMPRYRAHSISCIQGLLPASLRRLVWKDHVFEAAPPDLAHLSQLYYLQLEGWRGWDASLSSRLPESLQELRLHMVAATLAQLQQQRDILAEGPCHTLNRDNSYHLPRFTNIQSLVVGSDELLTPPTACQPLQQLTKLSALEVFTNTEFMQPVVSAVSSLAGLRRLHLRVGGYQLRPGLAAACTQLTQLVVESIEFDSAPQQLQQQQGSWLPELGRMAGLRWLSVPGLLLAADQAWLGGLKQLQVLVLSSQGSGVGFHPQVLPQVVEGLERCSPEALPPRLLLLALTGVTPEEAAALHVRRRLQQALSSSGCEVVVGVDLDEVGNPVKQLAGLPVALQQALA